MKALFILVPFLLVVNGCVETVDVPLDTAAPQLVVEGKVTENADSAYVLLSLSNAFYDKAPREVEGATVRISDDLGNTALLTYQGEGRYVTDGIEGIAGRKYHLEINYQGQDYEAWTTMPAPPSVASIEVRYFQENILREEGYYIVVSGIDPDFENGYYRLLLYKNGTLLNPLGRDDLFVATTDEEGPGIEEFEVPVAFEIGDRVTLKILKMDKAAYVFYQSYLLLLLNDGGLFGSPPANPDSNISNEALGLFQAVSVLEKEVEVVD